MLTKTSLKAFSIILKCGGMVVTTLTSACANCCLLVYPFSFQSLPSCAGASSPEVRRVETLRVSGYLRWYPNTQSCRSMEQRHSDVTPTVTAPPSLGQQSWGLGDLFIHKEFAAATFRDPVFSVSWCIRREMQGEGELPHPRDL